MASQYKLRKIKSKYVCGSELKNKKPRCKRVAFYTPSLRRELNNDMMAEFIEVQKENNGILDE